MSFINIKRTLAIIIVSLAVLLTSCSLKANDKVGKDSEIIKDPIGSQQEEGKKEENNKPQEPNKQEPIKQEPIKEEPVKEQPVKEESKVVKFGDKGSKVQYIQERLIAFNYPIHADKDFGEETLWAIKDFQRKNNISDDGIVGEETLNKLKEVPTEKTKYKAVDYSKFTGSKEDKENFVNGNNLFSETNNLITVSLKDREVNIFSYSNKRWNLIKVFKCSIGHPDTPTVTGDFKIGYRGYSFGQEKGYVCKYYTQFYGAYLFHSILYDLNGGVLDSRMGEAVSHGCIRLELENAKYIFDNIQEKTRVIVR